MREIPAASLTLLWSAEDHEEKTVIKSKATSKVIEYSCVCTHIWYPVPNLLLFSKRGHSPRFSHAQLCSVSVSRAISYIVQKTQVSLYISNHHPLFSPTAILQPRNTRSQTAKIIQPSQISTTMSDIQDYIDTQHHHLSSQTFETAMFLQNPLPNLSLTGLLAQHRQRNLQSRMINRSNWQHPLPSPGSLVQDTPRPTQTSPSTTPTSSSSPSTAPASAPCSPGQLTYHHSNALYAQTHLRLNLLIIELTEETRRYRNHNTTPSRPQLRDPVISIFEKEQEIAALLERLDAIAQGVQDLSEGEDGVWGYSTSSEGDGGEDDEAAAAAGSLEPEPEEWISEGRLSDEEVNEAVAEAWRDVYPELELCRYPLNIVETDI